MKKEKKRKRWRRRNCNKVPSNVDQRQGSTNNLRCLKKIIPIGKFFNNKEAIGEGTRTKYKDITTCMEINYIKTKNHYNIYGMKTPRVDSPTLTKTC
jgi:hypothetical protein